MHPAKKRITTHGAGTSKDWGCLFWKFQDFVIYRPSRVWEVYYGPGIVYPGLKNQHLAPGSRLFQPKIHLQKHHPFLQQNLDGKFFQTCQTYLAFGHVSPVGWTLGQIEYDISLSIKQRGKDLDQAELWFSKRLREVNETWDEYRQIIEIKRVWGYFWCWCGFVDSQSSTDFLFVDVFPYVINGCIVTLLFSTWSRPDSILGGSQRCTLREVLDSGTRSTATR